MEAGSADVSFDLLIKGLLAAGSTPAEIGERLAAVPFPKTRKTTRRKVLQKHPEATAP
jgi:hypothetical protein